MLHLDPVPPTSLLLTYCCPRCGAAVALLPPGYSPPRTLRIPCSCGGVVCIYPAPKPPAPAAPLCGLARS